MDRACDDGKSRAIYRWGGHHSRIHGGPQRSRQLRDMRLYGPILDWSNDARMDRSHAGEQHHRTKRYQPFYGAAAMMRIIAMPRAAALALLGTILLSLFSPKADAFHFHGGASVQSGGG